MLLASIHERAIIHIRNALTRSHISAENRPIPVFSPDHSYHVVVSEHRGIRDKQASHSRQQRRPLHPRRIAFNVAAPATPIPEKVSITPHTVPNNPINGPPATAVDKNDHSFSSDSASVDAARSSAYLKRFRTTFGLILIESESCENVRLRQRFLSIPARPFFTWATFHRMF